MGCSGARGNRRPGRQGAKEGRGKGRGIAATERGRRAEEREVAAACEWSTWAGACGGSWLRRKHSQRGAGPLVPLPSLCERPLLHQPPPNPSPRPLHHTGGGRAQLGQGGGGGLGEQWDTPPRSSRRPRGQPRAGRRWGVTGGEELNRWHGCHQCAHCGGSGGISGGSGGGGGGGQRSIPPPPSAFRNHPLPHFPLPSPPPPPPPPPPPTTSAPPPPPPRSAWRWAAQSPSADYRTHREERVREDGGRAGAEGIAATPWVPPRPSWRGAARPATLPGARLQGQPLHCQQRAEELRPPTAGDARVASVRCRQRASSGDGRGWAEGRGRQPAGPDC